MDSRRNRRRVPDELRKRTCLSCDLCRRRRCKCIRRGPDEDCVTCRQTGVACTSTFRRKTRLYGSVETIRDRILCLEAIVKGAFPDASIDSIPALLELGRRAGYPMPEIDTARHEDSHALEQSGLADKSFDGIPSPKGQSNDPPEQIGPIAHPPRLVRDSYGHSHYIGPSGTLSFFAELRDLISEQQPASRFASDTVAEALEAQNSPDHPHPPSGGGFSPATAAYMDEVARSRTHLQSLSPQVTEMLLQRYFEHVHPDFPLFNRTVFHEEYERYLYGDPSSKEPDDGWIVCLHLTLAFGCFLHGENGPSSLADPAALQSRCWNLARSALPKLLTTCTVANVQALLLMAHFYHNSNDRNAAWTLVGCAARIAVALGLHRSDVNQSFHLVERETRKRLWCTLYGFEQFLCLSLGRPSAIDNSEVTVEPPSDDIVNASVGPPGCAKAGVELQLLSGRLREMMRSLHRAATPTSSAQRQVTDPNTLLQELHAWKDGIPPYLSLPPLGTDRGQTPSPSQLRTVASQYPPLHLRAIVLLHISYHNLVILVTRPYLLMVISQSWRNRSALPCPWEDDGRSASTTGSPLHGISRLARCCVASASSLSGLLLLLDSTDVLNGRTGLDLFYAYSAAMALLLRLLWTAPDRPHEGVAETEERSRGHIQRLVSELRRVLGTSDKCLTMQRLATVVENFADAVQASIRDTQHGQTTEMLPPATEITQHAVHANPPAASMPSMEAPFPDQSSWSDSLLWQDSIQVATQHIVDWSNFEEFLGSFDAP